MKKGEQDMTSVVTNPLFGLALSILAYLIGMLIFRRFPHPLTTPLLLATILVILFILDWDFLQGLLYRRIILE